MKTLARIASLGAAAALMAGLAACSPSAPAETAAPDPSETAATGLEPITVAVGILAREEPEIQFLKEQLAPLGVTLEYQVINDNVVINRATYEGDLDANYFQNPVYLKAQNEANGWDLKTYGDWIQTSAVVFVSSKYPDGKLPDGAKIGIADDAANQARELQLLADNGEIELRDGVELPGLLDITSNPKNYEFVPVNPRSRAAAFPDFDAMTSPSITVYQMQDPSIEIIYEETPEVYENYGGVLWVVPGDTGTLPWLDAAIEIQTSDAYKQFLEDYYHGIKKANRNYQG